MVPFSNGRVCVKLGISIPDLETRVSGDRSHPYRKDRWRLHFSFVVIQVVTGNRYDNEHDMQELHKRNLLKGVKTCKLEFYKYCILGKPNRVQFKTTIHMTKGILDYVHIDV